jgi:hypothetical protein
MLFFSVARCAEALCQKTIQLLVQGMLACARARTWIPVEWPRSLGPLDCCEGAEKGQTWRVGMHTGS